MAKNTEEKLLDNYPTYVTLEQTYNIIEQLKKAFVKYLWMKEAKVLVFSAILKKKT